MLVLDSGAVSALASRSTWSLARIRALVRAGLWPPTVPTVVLVESLVGRPDRDANANRFLKTCDVAEILVEPRARRAAGLRAAARRGSSVDAIVIATAEPAGTVLTSDVADLTALAARSDGVRVERV